MVRSSDAGFGLDLVVGIHAVVVVEAQLFGGGDMRFRDPRHDPAAVASAVLQRVRLAAAIVTRKDDAPRHRGDVVVHDGALLAAVLRHDL